MLKLGIRLNNTYSLIFAKLSPIVLDLYAHMRTPIGMCLHMHSQVCLRTPTCVPTHTHTYAYVRLHAHAYTYGCTLACSHMRRFRE